MGPQDGGGRARRHLGRRAPRSLAARINPGAGRARAHADLPRVRVRVARGSQARAEAGNRPRLLLGVDRSPTAVLQGPSAGRNHGARGRPLQDDQGGGRRPVKQLRQQDAHAPFADSRDGARIRADPLESGGGATAPAQAHKAAAILGRARTAPRPARCLQPLAPPDRCNARRSGPAGGGGVRARLAGRKRRHRDDHRSGGQDGRGRREASRPPHRGSGRASVLAGA